MAVTDERIRERAQEFLSSRGLADLSLYWPTNKPLPQIDYESGEAKPDLLQLMAAFALSERDAAIEQCCRAMCVCCERGNEMVGLQHRLRDENNNIRYVDCKAAAIRSRVAAQGKLRKPLPVGWWGWDAEGNPIKDCPYGPNGMEEGECGL